MNELSVNHLLGIKGLTQADVDLIFKTADNFKEVINRPIKKVPSLRDYTIANIFFENSKFWLSLNKTLKSFCLCLLFVYRLLNKK